ncbi:MAG: hypothetical protein HWN68_06420 [Desulfobacterales bacterium]|nr:hypothetical protein [Desulfobacterales bacterium]
MKYTDKQLLDFLQKKNDETAYTGKCLFRMSAYGRGWRLYETSQEGAKKFVREVIADAIDKEKEEK